MQVTKKKVQKSGHLLLLRLTIIKATTNGKSLKAVMGKKKTCSFFNLLLVMTYNGITKRFETRSCWKMA